MDAMGGDYAPVEIIRGCLEASASQKSRIILVGNREKIESIIISEGHDPAGIEIKESFQEVGMNESPSEVLKSKKESSIYIGSMLASGKTGSAFLSAGNTGAVMACSLFNIKRIPGVLRPAIAVVVPLSSGKFILIDAGANADCKPAYLEQFALMGKVYSENILGVGNPKVALANIGAEEKKGSESVVKAFRLLKENRKINFTGNIEGREMFEGQADVVVTDGFTGNIILKVIEGLAKMFFGQVREGLTSSAITKLAAVIIKKPLTAIKRKFDYEEYGGAQLLGLKSPVIISHGSSKAKAIKNAIRVAGEALDSGLVGKIMDE
ncbi:MAG: phosphate acyltransferase PlsX, partial [Actinobacteria bacterium]|nr:phosphate acyltransferase PlsX [Actinomycetota bacterium]